MVADNRDAFWLTLREGAKRIVAESIPDGLSMVTANDLNDPSSARIRFYRPLFAHAQAPDPEKGDWEAREKLLGSRIWDGDAGPRGAMCVVTPTGFGTSSSTLLALPTVEHPEMKPVFRFCPGRPDETPWREVNLESASIASIKGTQGPAQVGSIVLNIVACYISNHITWTGPYNPVLPLRKPTMTRRRRIYEGKAKVLFEGPEPGTLVQYFKDDATAFNNQKRGIITGKGILNNRISEYLMTKLGEIGVPTHFVRRLNMREQLVREVEIIPIDLVVSAMSPQGRCPSVREPEGRSFPGRSWSIITSRMS